MWLKQGGRCSVGQSAAHVLMADPVSLEWPWTFPGEFEGFFGTQDETSSPLCPLVRCLAESFFSLSQEEISLQTGNLFPVKLNRRIRFPERACGCNKGLLPIYLAVHTELGTQVENFVCPKLHSWVYTNARVQSPHWAMTRGFRDAQPQMKISLEVLWGSTTQVNEAGQCHNVNSRLWFFA